MFDPVSTYRIQFHKDLTFSDLEGIIPYLADLGIKTLYASPIFTAVPGSNHGYDGVDPLSINPEIGTLEQLREVTKTLKQAGISWIQDIVPNHMAFHHQNKWLMDMLKNGPASPYKDYFDQSLADGSFFKGPIMVPFLSDDLKKVIEDGQLQIVTEDDTYYFAYADQRWPLNDSSIEGITNILQANNDKTKLLEIAGKQHYRLCSWKETDNTINFRRFFTVNSLICLNIQKQEVFNHFHQLIAELVNDGVFQGLRIDHIDGLYDPEQYLQRLRDLVGDETYIVVEKILESGEKLPDWPIQGTTGYDFLAQVNNLFTNKRSEKAFTEGYEKIAGEGKAIPEQISDKKRLILTTYMNGELENLTNYYLELQLGEAGQREAIKQSIAQLLINLPIYRLYGNKWPLPEDEQQEFEKLLNSIKDNVLDFSATDRNEQIKLFYQRCMQFSGPLMAKGVEDTLMYTYNRFIAHNEVGDAPAAFGSSVDEFHQLMQERQQSWPLALNGTSTHDTKRGEDVRARLNVLSYLGDEWLEIVSEWREANKALKTNNAPDANDEYFIYQTLVGTYSNTDDIEVYKERLSAYLEKVLREAKVNSNWAEPNEAYETAAKNFATALLNMEQPFWDSFSKFQKKVAEYGTINTLSQLLLKLTCPGVPDIYQGCEMWDLSMVDPDNRRPVDYELRERALKADADLATLWQNRSTGEIKLILLQKLLKFRLTSAAFTNGDYLPLQVTGKHADEVIAFARVYNGEWVVTIAPLTLTTVAAQGLEHYKAKDWGDTAVILPIEAPTNGLNILSGKEDVFNSKLKLKKLLAELPLSVIQLKPSDNKRSAGVLLHITSLPSHFGTGDLGKQAYAFADKLKAANQRYWQILPLNAVSADSAYSPYSSVSSQAGNILLISPELLAEQGLLNDGELKKYQVIQGAKSDFKAAQSAKEELLSIAWKRFNTLDNIAALSQFKSFCTTESWWLDDFALYSLLKELNDSACWNQWPEEYKYRRTSALQQLTKEYQERFDEIKWYQFLFTSQWNGLKLYSNQLGIKIFGDLPFYISYDSADVWANPKLFNLDDDLEMISVCGVPPDYFNENGQRWGMPVYNWDKLKETRYDWWLKRIGKNLQWYDVLRLDHFRAFSAYWDVPASEETAVDGKWVKGPGEDLFDLLQQTFPAMPLIAEDLGEIDEPVYALKDKYQLPGMKVLQFGFGDDIAQSPHISHLHQQNFVVYTGTHDNNTILGWYRHDADDIALKNLKRYTGSKIKADNVADVMIREALSSVCDLAVIPVQDWLNLSEAARMNTPAGEGENWVWQLTKEQLDALPVKHMKKLTQLFGRA